MSAKTRPARAEEIARLWPAVRAAHITRTAEELADYHRAAPWRVRVTDRGEFVVLGAWRQHLSILAIRGLWAPAHRIGELVTDTASVARAQGFDRIMSPLVSESEAGPYRLAGLMNTEPVVAIQGQLAAVVERCASAKVRSIARLRPATRHDVEVIGTIDSSAFADVWAYGWPEIADAIEFERVCVAEEGGAVVGYATVAIHGSTATLGRLAVDVRSRRHGVGRALLADAAGWALRSGATGLALCTQQDNAGARALYASAGLGELREPYAVLFAAV